MLLDATVYQDSLESQHLDVLSFNCVPMKNNVPVECYAALEFVPHHVSHLVIALTTNCVMVVAVLQSVQMILNAHHFTVARTVSASKSPDAPMM